MTKHPGNAVAATGRVERRKWTAEDAVLYALAVGAGSVDASTELEYATADLGVGGQRVLPSFASVIGRRTADALDALGDVDRTGLVHGEQTLRLYAPLPPEGEADVQSEIVAIHEKRTGTLVRITTTGLTTSGTRLFESESGTFLRGVLGIGDVHSDTTTNGQWSLPKRKPDVTIRQSTRPEQALLYRLTGDMNPLHADPEVAQNAGFAKPILHGLCTYGFACRAIVERRGDDLHGISARFSAPVYPGDSLTTYVWHDGAADRFVVDNDDGLRVLDRGAAW